MEGLPNLISDSLPDHWDLLSDDDKLAYVRLRRYFSTGPSKHVRNSRIDTFEGMIESIRSFAERGDETDWCRFLVCGVCWMENAIAINTRQLRVLVSKCKSSINGCFQQMGYTTSMSHCESWKVLFRRIPLLKDSFAELRQWTIRYKSNVSISSRIPDIDIPPVVNPIGFEARGSAEAEGQNPTVCPLKFRRKLA
jgi:hypothetical protein